jgi:hypothetical protein
MHRSDRSALMFDPRAARSWRWARLRSPTVPSRLHEVLVAMFRDQPELVADVLTNVLGVPIPDYTKAQVTAWASI